MALPKTGLDVTVAGVVSPADIGIPGGVARRTGIDIPVEVSGARYRCGPIGLNRAISTVRSQPR